MKAKKNNIPDINLNLNVRGLPPSATLAINEKSTQLCSDRFNGILDP